MSSKKVILFKLDGLYFLVIGCVFILLVYFIFLVFIFIHLFKTELQANDKGMLNLTIVDLHNVINSKL